MILCSAKTKPYSYYINQKIFVTFYLFILVVGECVEGDNEFINS